jgi:hypothetical protein
MGLSFWTTAGAGGNDPAIDVKAGCPTQPKTQRRPLSSNKVMLTQIWDHDERIRGVRCPDMT